MGQVADFEGAIETMITITKGDMFAEPHELLVNPVNCVGVMGAGLAAVFRRRYPKAHEDYVEACKEGKVQVGTMFLTSSDSQVIAHFPTKDHYRNPSELSYVVDGMRDLRRILHTHAYKSCAIPALGCGLGGLAWSDVLPVIIDGLGCYPGKVTVFEPVGDL